MIKAHLQFKLGTRTRTINKEFSNQSHMDNYIGYMERTYGWIIDECFILNN